MYKNFIEFFLSFYLIENWAIYTYYFIFFYILKFLTWAKKEKLETVL